MHVGGFQGVLPGAMGYNMNKAQKQLYNIRRGRVAIRQILAISKLLDSIGVPEFVEVMGHIGNSSTIRLEWFIARRKDVKPFEKAQEEFLTPEERQAIQMLVPFK